MIKLSKKWDYWLKAVLYISKNSSENINIRDISISEKIPEVFLRRIISDLEKSGILKTKKWRNWWVSLWKQAKDISLYDIFFALWEELSVSDCSAWLDCINKHDCLTTSIFVNLQKSFNGILKMQTLDKI